MREPSLPADEACRLASLRRLNILDTPAEERFDRLTRIARRYFGVDAALVGLIDADRQWFKARHGFDLAETPRRISFCGHTILADGIFTVTDAAGHPDFADNPLVTGGPRVRFYAGAPLRTPDGARVGTLCILDRRPRRLVEGDLGALRDLADCAEAELVASVPSQSERFLRAIADAWPGMISYWGRDLRCRFANRTYSEWFGRSLDEIIGISLPHLMGLRLFALSERYINGALAGEAQVFERTMVKADGGIGHTKVQYIPDRDEQGEIIGIFVLANDLSPLKAAEAELKLAASIYHNTIEGIIVTDANGTILSVNPAFTEITGFTTEEAIGQNPRILKSDHHDLAFYRGVWQSLVTTGRWQGQIWNRRKNGEVFLEWQTITVIPDESGQPARYVSVFNDITELWRKDEKVRHLAFHDALTELPNRALLSERFDHMMAVADREGRQVAVLFLDLDGFKAVNDRFGHDVGDDLLRGVAARLLSLVRTTDTVARLGGDEFVVLLDNPANEEEIAVIAARIIAVVSEPMEIRGRLAQVGLSIGIARFPCHGPTSATVLATADRAMYEAKAAGKNTYRFSGG